MSAERYGDYVAIDPDPADIGDIKANGTPTFQYQAQRRQAQQQGSPDPSNMMNLIQRFQGGGTSNVAGSWIGEMSAGGEAGGGAAEVAGSGIGEMGGTGAGGGSAYSGLAAAGPWAALAAAIIANESYQRNTGNRREGMDGYKDAIDGAVIRQDTSRYTDNGKSVLGGEMMLNADMGSPMSFKHIGEDFKKTLGGRILKKIF